MTGSKKQCLSRTAPTGTAQTYICDDCYKAAQLKKGYKNYWIYKVAGGQFATLSKIV